MSIKPTIAEMNIDLGEFMQLKHIPVQAGFESGNSYVSIDKEFESRSLFLKYCNEINAGADPEYCYFPLPNVRDFKLRYHESYDWLLPVWQKFSRLKFDGDNERIFLGHEIVISKTILYGPITEAHRLIWEVVKWLETIKNK